MVWVGSHERSRDLQNASLILLVTLLLMQPGITSRFQAASTCCKVVLASHQPTPYVFFLSADLNPFFSQLVFLVWTHTQDCILGLVELHEAIIGPLLNPNKVPLNGILSLQNVDSTSQPDAIGKLV